MNRDSYIEWDDLYIIIRYYLQVFSTLFWLIDWYGVSVKPNNGDKFDVTLYEVSKPNVKLYLI